MGVSEDQQAVRRREHARGRALNETLLKYPRGRALNETLLEHARGRALNEILLEYPRGVLTLNSSLLVTLAPGSTYLS